jgi:hypothetical protein
MSFNNYLTNFVTLTTTISDDYIWFEFRKPCGYSFIFPFIKNSPSSALYSHIDSLWHCTNNFIWNQKGELLSRAYNKSIRDWIRESQMESLTPIGQPIVYRITFDVHSNPDLNNIETHLHC